MTLGEAVSDMSVSRARRRRYLRVTWLGGALAVVAFAAVTARVFVWPDLKPLPAHADAIVELGERGRSTATWWLLNWLASRGRQCSSSRR